MYHYKIIEALEDDKQKYHSDCHIRGEKLELIQKIKKVEMREVIILELDNSEKIFLDGIDLIAIKHYIDKLLAKPTDGGKC